VNDNTSGLFYDHIEQVQLYASELKIVMYVDNQTGSRLEYGFELITEKKTVKGTVIGSHFDLPLALNAKGAKCIWNSYYTFRYLSCNQK